MWVSTISHHQQIAELKQALASSHLPHAILFCGIEGIGKKRVAYGLAQALNCLAPSAPCGECLSCEKIEKGIHPDCHWIVPAKGRIKIESVRELKQKIFLHPLEGKAKIVLIDEADAMTESAANALLKILEEPPADTYFILISFRPFGLLPTIRSRCQRLEFSPIPGKEIEFFLMQRGMSVEESRQRALLSQGSLKRALEWDIHLFETIREEIDALLKNPQPGPVLALSEKWVEEDEKIEPILASLNVLWHQKMLETCPPAGVSKKVIDQWGTIQQALKGLETYANKQLLMESLLFSLVG